MAFAGIIVISDNSEATDSATPVNSIEGLNEAIKSDDFNVKLKEGTYSDLSAITILKSGTLDLTGCTLIRSDADGNKLIGIGKDNNTNNTAVVTIIGGTIISNNDGSGAAVQVLKGTTLTLKGTTISSGSYGIAVWDSAKLIVDDADITATICAISGNGTQSGTEITINDGTFTSTENAAIYFPSTQKLDINGGTFNGKTGIDIRAGTITIDNAIINVNQTGTISQTPKDDNGPSTMGMGIAIIDTSNYGAGTNISVTVNNTTINGAVYDYYVGDKNLILTKEGTVGDLIGAKQFNTAGLLEKTWTPAHDIKLTIGALTIDIKEPDVVKAAGFNYRLAITTATDSSFSIAADSIFDGKITYTDNKDKTQKSADFTIMAGVSGVTFTKGSISISGNVVTGTGTVADLDTIIGGMSLTADLVFKDLTITGNGNITVPDVTVEGIVTIDEKVTILSGSIIVDNNATLNVKGNVELATIENNGTIAVSSDEAKLPNNVTGTGTVDTSTIQEDVTIGGTINTDTDKALVFSAGQTVTLVSDTILVKNTKMTVNGILVIPEGITLTLQDSSSLLIVGPTSKVINNGTIIVESEGRTDTVTGFGKVSFALNGGLIENNGTISINWENENLDTTGWYGQSHAFLAKTGTIENNGTIEVAEGNTFGIVYAKVNNYETIYSEGGLVGYVNNSGTVTIDGFAWGTIFMVSSEATVNVVSLTTNPEQPLTISDAGIKNSKGDSINTNGTNIVVLEASNTGGTANGYNTIEGIIVESNIYYKSSNKTYYNQLLISGNIDYSTKKTEIIASDKFATIGLSGKGIIADDTLAISEHIATTVTENSILTISGEASVDGTISNVDADRTGKVVVTGTLTMPKAIGCVVEAAHYKIAKDLTAGTPEKYIYTNLANAISAAPKEITVTGLATIDSEITIPAGTTVKMQDELKVTKDGFMTVKDGSKVAVTGNADVAGVLSIENKKNLTAASIISDVTTSDDASIIYSGLSYALSVAESGQTVKVSTTATSPITTKSDITIKDGVTLDMAGKDLEVGTGYVLTIDGILFLDNSKLSVGGPSEDGLKDAGKVILNGAIKSVAEMNYNIGTAPLTGAYYVMLEKGALYNYVEPVSAAAEKVSTFYNQTVAIVGEQNLGNVTFVGTSDAPVTVTVNGTITDSTVTIDCVNLIGNKEINKTITDGTGKVILSKVTGSTAENSELTISSADVSSKKTFLIKGTVATIGNDGSMEISGITVNGAVMKDVTIGENVIVSDNSTATEVIVNGSLFVDNEKTFAVSGDMYVLGSVDTADKTDSKVAGKITIAKCLYIGLDKPTTGASASVDGTVSVTGLTYVMAGSTIDPSLIENKKGVVEFYVDGKLYMTAYADNAGATLVGLPEYELEDADVQGWYDEDGNEITSSSSMPSGKVSAKIDYNIYTVYIIADEGIGTVAVDGIVAVNYLGNIYQVSNLAAGAQGHIHREERI